MGRIALVDVDVYKSSLLNRVGSPNREADDPHPVLTLFDATLDEVAHEYSGQTWDRSGDGRRILFTQPSKALEAVLALLERVGHINAKAQADLDGALLLTRIGIHLAAASLGDVPPAQRGSTHNRDLDLAGKLQKGCPIGRVAISTEFYERLNMLRRLFRPVRLSPEDLRAFVLTERVISPQEERLFAGMPSAQKLAMPPVPFFSWDRLQPDPAASLRTLAKTCEELLLIILGESSDRVPPFRPAWTSDATGIIEAVAALRSNPSVEVAIDTWEDTAELVTDRHILLVGAGDVNAYAFVVNDLMAHLRFRKDHSGVVNVVQASSRDDSADFGLHHYDVIPAGFVSISRSPFDPHHSLIWVAGVNGPATQAAARLLRDLIVDSNACLRGLELDEDANPIGCVVVPVSKVPDDGEQPGVGGVPNRRIDGYKLIWAVDRSGRRLRSGRDRSADDD